MFDGTGAGGIQDAGEGQGVVVSADEQEVTDGWYGVRCVFRDDVNQAFEERVTVWEAASSDEPIAQALADAQEHAQILNLRALDFAQAYAMPDPPTAVGSEVSTLWL